MARKYQRLLNKHVLIIGGSSGIGFGVAEACLAAGAKVTISSSSPDRVKQKVAELKTEYPTSDINGVAADLSKPTLVEDLESLFKRVSPLDHIVFTACDLKHMEQQFQDMTYEHFRDSGHMRLTIQFFIGRIGAKYLPQNTDSSITFTSGTSSEKPAPGWAMVAAYAAGLKGLVRNLAVDLKPVRVNVVSPGYVITELWNNMPSEATEPIFSHLRKTLPTAEVGTPENVAEAYLWLLKDANVTGTCAETNGGMKLI